eukprot:365291-Chlamydomonas_euryale.AAC.16
MGCRKQVRMSGIRVRESRFQAEATTLSMHVLSKQAQRLLNKLPEEARQGLRYYEIVSGSTAATATALLNGALCCAVPRSADRSVELATDARTYANL